MSDILTDDEINVIQNIMERLAKQLNLCFEYGILYLNGQWVIFDELSNDEWAGESLLSAYKEAAEQLKDETKRRNADG